MVSTERKGKSHACEEAGGYGGSILTVRRLDQVLHGVVKEKWVRLDGESGWMETERVK